MKTILTDRVLWYDGTNEVNPEIIPELLLLNVPINRITATRLDDDLIKFNDLQEGAAGDLISVSKKQNTAFDFAWKVPAKYFEIDLAEFAMNQLTRLNLDIFEYLTRVADELELIFKMRLVPIFQTLIYVIDELRANNRIWGIGRGSSCASLILFLIGIHSVDPVRYDISLEEFFHE